MLLRRLYDSSLAQASYLLGCQATGEALVIDPNRDIEQYERVAREEGLRITAVTETHIHADFVSGSRELAASTGARLLLSGEGGRDWQYAFIEPDRATLLHDGTTFMVGNLRLDVLHTPGHTPEHLSFLVTDTPATDRPFGLFTGDFIFVGDVGRPDLLERAAGAAGTMEPSARALFQSLRQTASLPDYVQIFPGHGAGSACGKALGAVPSTTLGYERIANWAFNIADEDAFVRAVLAGQPEAPAYFAEMKRINRDGPPPRGTNGCGAQLPRKRLMELIPGPTILVDVRPAAAFAEGHVPGALNIPHNSSFSRWAGALLPYDTDFVLVATGEDDARAASRALSMIGLDRCQGYLDSAALAGMNTSSVVQVGATELHDMMRRAEIQVVDVRDRAEWESGHLPGVPNIPLAHLAEGATVIPLDRPIAVHCQSGGRSAIAASVLAARGFQDVRNLSGGIVAWRAAELPTEHRSAVTTNG